MLRPSVPARRIEDYAVIGNCCTAALVAPDGSIDWMCMPRFDSAACFAALLGTDTNGRWLLAPKGKVTKTERRYRDGSMTLETDFETAEGAVRIVDLMPIDPAMRVIRQVEGLRGTVTMHMELVIRYDYGTRLPWVRRVEGGALSATAGPDTLRLVTDVEVRGEDMKTVADFTVSEGQKIPFVLSWQRSHYDPEPEIDAALSIADTERWWAEWIGRCEYDGPYKDDVRRSLVILKALTHARTGGMVAAVTTSLPEELGGSRNWDYRYCWLRDASFVVRAFVFAGYHEEAKAYRDWVMRAAGGDPEDLQIMYGTAGERRLEETTIPELAGFRGSLPVRIGNAAHKQMQHDVYGELLIVLEEVAAAGMAPDANEWSFIKKILASVEDVWQKPDSGIWEVRGEPRHFTFSKIMCWVAFDRALKIADAHGFEGPLDRWRATREVIAEEVWTKGFDAERNTLVQSYGSKDLDASVLIAPFVGFVAGDDPRMLGTTKAVEDHLMHNGFVRRYLCDESLDGQQGDEGAFLACSFWLVGNYLRQGRKGDAKVLFDRILGACNDVGLFSEEWDAEHQTMLGNFPQAFTHLALVISALHFAAS